jgi:hypothetical protein
MGRAQSLQLSHVQRRECFPTRGLILCLNGHPADPIGAQKLQNLKPTLPRPELSEPTTHDGCRSAAQLRAVIIAASSLTRKTLNRYRLKQYIWEKEKLICIPLHGN